MPEIGKQEWDLLQVALETMTNTHVLGSQSRRNSAREEQRDL
jgi:hypothetical protein